MAPRISWHLEVAPVETLATDWIDRLGRIAAGPTGPILDDLRPRAALALEALASGLARGPATLDHAELRPAVQMFSLIGGWLASRRATPTLAAHFLPALSGCLIDHAVLDGGSMAAWGSLEPALSAIVFETFCASLRAAEREAHQRVLESCTPLVTLPGPTVLLVIVGDPNRAAMQAVCGRVLLEVARGGARRVWIDLTWAQQPLPESALDVIGDLVGHRKLRDREIIVSATPEDVAPSFAKRLAARDDLCRVTTWAEGMERATRG